VTKNEHTATMFECIDHADVDFTALGTKGGIFIGHGRIRPGQRIGVFVGAVPEGSGLPAMPDPAIEFERNWVPEAIRTQSDFSGVVIHVTAKQLAEQFRQVGAANAV
jgi:hypothetical protein